MLCRPWIAATFAHDVDNVENAEHAAMRRAAWREPASRAEGAPYRHLAVRVIAQAFRDLAIPTGSAAGQESARKFLAGNSMLYYWCEVADLNPVWLVARARRLMAASAESQPRPWIVEVNPVLPTGDT